MESLLKKRLTAISRQLIHTLLVDESIARREIHRMSSALASTAVKDDLKLRCDQLEQMIQKSIARCQQRQTQRLHLDFDADLPINAKKDELVKAIQQNQVLIIAGETGSGKTTQLPKLCLAAGLGVRGCIGVTQPRRIAATTVSRRIAFELNESLGQTVGCKIRFQDTTGNHMRIKVMTDGILLAETHRDRLLRRYDTLIVDEAHERSLNIDFILGLLKKIVKKRADLKVIITSATIDTDKFAHAFDGAPVIVVSGRMYPVETRWADPLTESDADISHIEMAARSVDELTRPRQSGDLLIFMPTEQDIRDTCDLLEGRRYPNTVVIPLYARLSATAQQKVFEPIAERKIIVATNVAETSITIPNIRYVIDSGLARIPQYTPRSRTMTMPIVPISQSSADQRKGRCGRVSNGICIRLFSEEDFDNRPKYTLPEILRANLADVILRMIALDLGEVEKFPFIDPPAPSRIQDGYNLLLELGAICQNKTPSKKNTPFSLTEKGRLMSRLPLDPRLSCMLIEADKRGCLDDVAIIAAALSIQDPRERPLEKQDAADAAQSAFLNPLSDFIALLNVWHLYHDAVIKKTGWKDVKRFCRNHFLSFRRMREWKDIYHQILAVLEEQHIRPKAASINRNEDADTQNSWYAAVHQSILCGFLSNIAVKKENRLFQASHNREVMIFPGSGLFKKPGEWIVAAEMVETTRLFARCAAVIAPHWIEAIGKDQCKYAYHDPHWEKNRGEVVVTEHVSLYGLVFTSRKRSYGPLNPEQAQDIFIRQALVGQDVRQSLPFMVHNASVIAEIENMEQRLRRRDLLVDEQDLIAFYHNRLDGVYSLTALRKHIRRKGNDQHLRMRPEQVTRYQPSNDILDQYPERMKIEGQQIAYRYHFTPGLEEDGVTAHIPSGIVGALSTDIFQWLVPGLLKDKIAALIKTLPKDLRKQLVPIAETVDIIAKQMSIKQNTSLAVSLSRFIQKKFKVAIPPTAWDEKQLPDHLRMRYAVIDDQGKVVKTTRDPAVLKQSTIVSDQPQDFETARKSYERENIEQWDFGDLTETIQLASPGGRIWRAFPALEKREDALVLTAFTDRAHALREHRRGVKALLMRCLDADIKYLRKNLALPKTCDAAARYFGGLKKIETALLDRVLTDLLAKDIRCGDAFIAYMQTLKSGGFTGQGQTARQCLIDVLDHYHSFRLHLLALENAHQHNRPGLDFLTNLRLEMQRLIPETFVVLYDDNRLKDLVRYIKAAVIRAQRGLNDLEKDQGKQKLIEPFSQQLGVLIQSLSIQTSKEKRLAIEDLFWTVEEFKISIFAQEIKTAFSVSPKTIRTRIKAIEQML